MQEQKALVFARFCGSSVFGREGLQTSSPWPCGITGGRSTLPMNVVDLSYAQQGASSSRVASGRGKRDKQVKVGYQLAPGFLPPPKLPRCATVLENADSVCCGKRAKFWLAMSTGPCRWGAGNVRVQARHDVASSLRRAVCLGAVGEREHAFVNVACRWGGG